MVSGKVRRLSFTHPLILALARLRTALVVMIVGHVVILSLGWLRLAWSLGPSEAFAAGFAPFLLGGLAKSIVAGVVVGAGPWRIRQPASTLVKVG